MESKVGELYSSERNSAEQTRTLEKIKYHRAIVFLFIAILSYLKLSLTLCHACVKWFNSAPSAETSAETSQTTTDSHSPCEVDPVLELQRPVEVGDTEISLRTDGGNVAKNHVHIRRRNLVVDGVIVHLRILARVLVPVLLGVRVAPLPQNVGLNENALVLALPVALVPVLALVHQILGVSMDGGGSTKTASIDTNIAAAPSVEREERERKLRRRRKCVRSPNFKRFSES